MARSRKLRDFVLANWPIKVTALILATALWAVVAAEETTTQLVPVDLDLDPPLGRTFTSELPDVQALYGGSLRDLLRLYETPPVIRKAIPDTITGSTFTMRLTTDDLGLVENADVRAQEIVPNAITVHLDDFLEKKVPLVANAALATDSGFELFGEVRLSPDSVTVRGPEALVRGIVTLSTMAVKEEELGEPFRQVVAVDTSGLGVVRVSPDEIELTADIGPVSEHVLMGVSINISGARGNWESVPSAVIVTVKGPSSRVVRFTRDSVEVVARPSLSQAEEVVSLEIVVPPGITARATPDTATVRRRRRG